ncbi:MULTISPECIES: Rv1476 family membrane protein [Corynebacterium]|uniref:Rv1476 family membrane protein n=1 Tax=Corynebacterium TaxID=1716 RepID=UPI00124C4D70|nr:MULTISPECIES: DUF6676 family protein [Corynebacterium]
MSVDKQESDTASMVPSSIDMASIIAQLEEDGVAFSYEHEGNAALNAKLVEVVDMAEGEGYENPGIIVLGAKQPGPGDERDIAQAAADATDSSLMMVRTPGSAAVVSSEHARADIESVQYSLATTTDYVLGAREVVEELPGSSVGAVPLVVGTLALVAVATAFSARWSAKLHCK